MRRIALSIALASIPFVFAATQQSNPYPQRPPAARSEPATQDDHEHMKMNERGEEGMGFSQTATTHHFLLKPNGGVIQVESDDPAETANRDHIHLHLTHIARAFAAGQFNIPMFVHDTVPPGVPEMKRLHKKIRYTYEESPNGGRVLISTQDPDALVAIHNFLRFQIEQHRTGDPTTLK